MRLLDCPLGHQCYHQDGKETVYCAWYVKLRGKDPQTDQDIDEYRCAIAWLPVLQIEHSLFERQTGAAVESLRNNVEKANHRAIEATKARLINADPDD